MEIKGSKDQIASSHIHNNRDDEANVANAAISSGALPSDHHHLQMSNQNNNIDDVTEDLFGSGVYVNEIIEIMEEDEELLVSSSSSSLHRNKYNKYNVEKLGGQQRLVAISEGGGMENSTSLFSIDIHNKNSRGSSSEEDVVYVAVGKSESSMEALLWTLKHCVQPGTTLVYLIHVFSDLKFIPSPFGGGMVPKTQVSPDLVETYLAEDSRKRRELLTKYVDKCTSHLVQVETILIESDSVARAIVELISVLNIRHLVIGISKSNLRKVKVGKRSAIIADQIRQSISHGCDLKIICQGRQLNMSEDFGIVGIGGDHLLSSSAIIPSIVASGGDSTHYEQQSLPTTSNSHFSCCFKTSNQSTLP